MPNIFLSLVEGNKNQIQKEQALKKACQDFEAFFIYYLLKVMRKTIPKTKLFYGGIAQDIYTSILDEQLAKKAGETNSLGLAILLYQQLSTLQKSPNILRK